MPENSIANNKKIDVRVVLTSVINFAMDQNYVPIIGGILIGNPTKEDLQNVNVKVSIKPEFAKPWEKVIDKIPAESAVEISPVPFRISPDILFNLTEKVLSNISIEIYSGEEELSVMEKDVEVLAIDEWSGSLIMPEIISAFVTPNHPKITETIIKAKEYMNKWYSDTAFTGYQRRNPNSVKQQMAAIYAALQKENISYSMPPASYEIIGQRVRLCDSVFEQKMATCLDSSILYASILESIGLNPLIILVHGHAFVGCWLEENCFPESIQDDPSVISKRIVEGINEIILVETTCFTAEKPVTFDNAVTAGINSFERYPFELLIDIKRSRASGIRPIPMKKTGEKYEFVDYGERDDKEITVAPKEIETFDKYKCEANTKVTRQQIWERKLLDLSLRNSLLNFRPTKSALQLMVHDLGMLEDELSSGVDFRILSRPEDWDDTIRDAKIYEIENILSALELLAKVEFPSKRIRNFLPKHESEDRLKHLYRQSKVSIEENGSNTLFLALGFLKWFETDLSEKERYAPIVLIPIDIVRVTRENCYVIRVRDEEPQINITLLEMLRQDFGINIGGLDPIPLDESGIDLNLIFNIFRNAIMNKARWDVELFSFIGLFSFSQFIMWNDLRNRSDELKESKVVSSFIEGEMKWIPNIDNLQEKDLDMEFKPVDSAIPISADSSQLLAINSAAKGESFVLHGPPGTGKSQTITNMITNALFQGKSVLFIAEKMAALSVVQNRLASLGLDPFCLELHSNKAKKKEVLNQFDNVLQFGKIKNPENYNEVANNLYELRKELNGIVEAVHKVQTFGSSLYDNISIYEEYKDVKGTIKFTVEDLEALTVSKKEEWESLIDKYIIAIKESGGRNNGLQEFNSENYAIKDKSIIEDLLRDYKTEINKLQKSINGYDKEILAEEKSDYGSIDLLIKLMDKLSEGKFILSNLIKIDNLKEMEVFLNTTIDEGVRSDQLRRSFDEIYNSSIYNYDAAGEMLKWREAQLSWFLTKGINTGKVVKGLKIHAKNPNSINKANIEEKLNELLEYAELQKRLSNKSISMKERFQILWDGEFKNWYKIKESYEYAVQLQDIIKALTIEKNNKEILIDKLQEYQEKYIDIMKEIVQTKIKIDTIEKNLVQYTNIDFKYIKENNTSWFQYINEGIDRWNLSLDTLKDWCLYVGMRNKLLNAGLNNLVKSYESGEVEEEIIKEAFYKNLSYEIIGYITNKENALRNFRGSILEDTIEKYKETAKEFEKLTTHELVARLSSKIPTITANTASSSELAILQKAIRSGGRMLSIRKLFDSIPNLLRRLCPCMLMSPISVAQYIDPKFPKFDLIIFDEASQIRTSEAVGAIARGENVVVVGDPKQLPPTSFFSSNQIDEDNFESEDLESLLEDCLALSMPQKHLLWHYRSKHESLIAYSNFKYYDNKLYTFPSPNNLKSEVELIELDGYYDRGKTKFNKAEAEAIVNEIVRRLKDPVLRNDSIGVVTFNSIQQNLIDDMLEEVFVKNPELEEINRKSKEPIFIKKLENVQGDERDIILFSIGYGPDSTGKVSMNFGPLNREGGWRRLNVAISRSRKKMIVFSTLKPEQINLSRTRSQGLADLRGFLEFAKNGTKTLVKNITDIKAKDQKIEEIISHRIRELGYDVRTNVGSSEYKIDIAVVNPNNKEEFIIGILCDGDNYKNANTARDRNILQGQVLKSLGWNIYRLWIIDWFDNEEAILSKIESFIEESLKVKKIDCNEKVVERKEKVRYEKVENVEAVEKTNEYLECALTIEGDPDEFYMYENNDKIVNQVKEVINKEGPISQKALTKKVISAWGINRSGARIDRRIQELLQGINLKTNYSNNTTFYWKDNQEPNEYAEYRVSIDSENKRSMDDISAEEVSVAIKEVLNNHVSLNKQDLTKETAKLFGYTRSGAIIVKSVESAIDKAIEREYIELKDEKLVIKN